MRVFKKKPKGPSISRAEALDRIPVKNRQISENQLETGEIVISYPVTMRPFFAGLAKRFGGQEVQTQMKKLELDELGTSVWNLMDGNRSVRQCTGAWPARPDRNEVNPPGSYQAA
jgi:hypothetical protein